MNFDICYCLLVWVCKANQQAWCLSHEALVLDSRTGSVVSPATSSQITESKVSTSKTSFFSSQSMYLSSKSV